MCQRLILKTENLTNFSKTASIKNLPEQTVKVMRLIFINILTATIVMQYPPPPHTHTGQVI